MKYSLQGERVPIYETDENGNIIYYTDSDGNKIPMETGEYTTGYSQPVSFFANINNKLNEVVWKDFGIDDSTNYVQICADKGYLPIKAGDVIWKKSEVTWKEDGLPDSDSADYVVKGVADEGLTVDLFLLQKNVK